MEKMLKWIVALGCIFFFLRLYSYAIPKLACLLLSILVLVVLIVLLIVALVVGLTKWRSASNFWGMPTLLCLTFILCGWYAASPLGRYVSGRIFQKHLGDYARVVDQFKDGNVRCANQCNGDVQVIKTTDRPAHVLDVWGAHCDDGGVIVLFLMDNGVPLLHEGYMFRDYAERSDCNRLVSGKSKWPYLRQIEGDWYRFSDQPGF